LADFQRKKGTLLDFDNVNVAEGPLPACARERASAHLRERENARQLRTPFVAPLDRFPLLEKARTAGLPQLLKSRPTDWPDELEVPEEMLPPPSLLPDLPDLEAELPPARP
ncbi:MAG: hypothetical protein AB7K24_07145, partial [Gemmataceae bacterium]